MGERTRAVQLLADSTERGDPRVIEILCQRLEHHQWSVRLSAAKALPLVVSKGDQTAVDALITRLDHKEIPVRLAALVVLPQLADGAGAGSQADDVMNALQRFLDDKDEKIKRAAAKAS